MLTKTQAYTLLYEALVQMPEEGRDEEIVKNAGVTINQLLLCLGDSGIVPDPPVYYSTLDFAILAVIKSRAGRERAPNFRVDEIVEQEPTT